MAGGRGLSSGGSFTRAQVLVTWALDGWRDFDAWCCVKGLDPLDLPSYRLYNLILLYIKEARTEEEIGTLEIELVRVDNEPHPLHKLGTSRSKKEAPVEKPKYVPSWWRGDNANAKVAMTMMKTLPKKV